jgi:hypothetical protein
MQRLTLIPIITGAVLAVAQAAVAQFDSVPVKTRKGRPPK